MLISKVLSPEEKREADLFFEKLEREARQIPTPNPWRNKTINKGRYNAPDFMMTRNYGK